jgi:hypothetical protein
MDKNKILHQTVAEKLFPLLPLTYALATTFFWIFILFTGKMHFVIERIASAAPSSLIIFYSLSALLFWFPSFRNESRLSFLHSLPLFVAPFFNMLYRVYRHKIVDHDYFTSVAKVYTAGFIVYIIAIAFLSISKWLLSKTTFLKHHKNIY